jgi:hypothetical protein
MQSFYRICCFMAAIFCVTTASASEVDTTDTSSHIPRLAIGGSIAHSVKLWK